MKHRHLLFSDLETRPEAPQDSRIGGENQFRPKWGKSKDTTDAIEAPRRVVSEKTVTSKPGQRGRAKSVKKRGTCQHKERGNTAYGRQKSTSF